MVKTSASLLVCVVFISVIRLCRSQLGPFSFLNYPRGESSLSLPSDLAFPFVIGSPHELELQGPQQAFLNLLSPIQSPLFPPNMLMIKGQLCELIRTNQLEVAPVMEYVNQFQHVNEFDLMIAALLSLRDTLPQDCPLRQALGQLIVHSIFNRCQSRYPDHTDYLGPVLRPVPTIPVPEPVPVPVPTQQLTCETIAAMIRYFQSLYEQSSCQECLTPELGLLFNNQFSQFAKRNSEQIQKRSSVNTFQKNLEEISTVNSKATSMSFEQLIDVLPKPQNQVESVKYNIVKEFLKSNEIRNYFKDVAISDYSNKNKFLTLVLNKISKSSVSTDVREAFSYYLHYGNTAVKKFDYTTLIDLLPQPLDEEEKEKITIVKSVLSGKDVDSLLKGIDAFKYSDQKLLLKAVLKTIASSKVDVKIKEAFTYYLNYQESLTELELFTKKEITKHFQLTKIFIDTLNIDSLSSDAKLAFKKFFKFISSITRDQIKDFDTWNDVKTKGEFMKALFRYLLAQSFVPKDVQDSITKLEPLVKMDGRGAAPP